METKSYNSYDYRYMIHGFQVFFTSLWKTYLKHRFPLMVFVFFPFHKPGVDPDYMTIHKSLMMSIILVWEHPLRTMALCI